MIVGVPKEIKNAERRVGLTPASVRELVAHGHDVIVETQAGIGIAASDDDYISINEGSPVAFVLVVIPRWAKMSDIFTTAATFICCSVITSRRVGWGGSIE